jgi:hypothetical protein
MALTHKDIWTNVAVSLVICIIIFGILFFWLIWLSGKQYDNENGVEDNEETIHSLNLGDDNDIIPKFSTNLRDNKFFSSTSATMIIEAGSSPIHHSNTNYKMVHNIIDNNNNNKGNMSSTNSINLGQISKNISEKLNKFNTDEVKSLKKSFSSSSMNRIQGGVSFAIIGTDDDDDDDDSGDEIDNIAIEL